MWRGLNWVMQLCSASYLQLRKMRTKWCLSLLGVRSGIAEANLGRTGGLESYKVLKINHGVSSCRSGSLRQAGSGFLNLCPVILPRAQSVPGCKIFSPSRPTSFLNVEYAFASSWLDGNLAPHTTCRPRGSNSQSCASSNHPIWNIFSHFTKLSSREENVKLTLS